MKKKEDNSKVVIKIAKWVIFSYNIFLPSVFSLIKYNVNYMWHNIFLNVALKIIVIQRTIILNSKF